MAEETPPEKRFAAIVDSYLTALHRDDPGHGCAVPTLGPEIARESAKTRKAFAAKLDEMIEMMADQVPARVAGSGDFSEEILGAGRAAALGRATKAPAKKPRAKAN
jgi:TetR/AcrR family transcriptional repressor of nem operon